MIVRPRSGRGARSGGWPGRGRPPPAAAPSPAARWIPRFRCRSGAGTRRHQAGWLRHHRRTARLARSGAGSDGAEHRRQTLRSDRGSVEVRFIPKADIARYNRHVANVPIGEGRLRLWRHTLLVARHTTFRRTSGAGAGSFGVARWSPNTAGCLGWIRLGRQSSLRRFGAVA